MASEVDICNQALANLGDSANVATLDEGSPQADHCTRFYPMARDQLLSMHDWSFATRRVALTQVTNPTTTWAYCYAVPNDMLRPIGVLSATASDDDSAGVIVNGYTSTPPMLYTGVYTPQPYRIESAANGSSILLTNQDGAVLRYVARVTDTSKFSAPLVNAIAGLLSSYLAGPIIKGDAGMKVARAWEAAALGPDGKSGRFGVATRHDAAHRHSTVRDRQQVPWLAGR